MQAARLARRHDWLRWVLVFALVGLASQAQAGFAATKIVTDADKGGEVRLKAGDSLELRLSSNPSTGYLWTIEKESTPRLKLVRQSQTEAAGPAVGQPIFQVFTFEAHRRGAGVLRLHYIRSWEKPAADERRFEIRVVVR
jgi:inhibitor of cysteine peptidase